MSEAYRHQTIYEKGGSAVEDAFHNQVLYCRKNDAPVTARVTEGVLTLLRTGAGGDLLDRVREWTGAPLADALPLRVAGGLHALHLAGKAPALGAIYRREPADDAGILREVIDAHEAELLPWLDGPPQTNEAGRSASFVWALLWLAERGLPARFECLEMGSSAGINLMLPRYRYDLGGVGFGPKDAAMRFAPEWRGPPPPDQPIEIVSMRGCDVAPVDLTDPAQALRLKAYIWPEHTVRFERMEAAVAAAKVQPPQIAKQDGASFVEEALVRPQAEGTTRVLLHSIVWQYVPHDQQDRIVAAMEAAGAKATADRPLAWVALEANRTIHRHELTVQYWPGGEKRVLLGYAHAHGHWVERLDPPQDSDWPER